jgi:hypothetical protein
MIRRLSSGPSAKLKTIVITALLLAAATAGAQPPDASPEHVPQPATGAAAAVTSPAGTPPASKSDEPGFHDLICKPNGTEDGFDCADEATPARIVPIPSQVQWPKRQDEPVST